MTSFRFTAAADATVDALFARHVGAARFAYNQNLGAVKEALKARRANATVDVPWTGFDMINHFNAWKHDEAAGRIWAVDSSGVTQLAGRGLVWRKEVCAQVFEEAAIDLGRALDTYAKSRNGARAGPRVGFPRFKKRGRCRESFRLRNRITGRGITAIRVGNGADLRSITLPVIGLVRVIEDTRRLRRLLRPSADGVPRARIWFATVSRHRGRWVITINVEAPDLHPARRHDRRKEHDHSGFVGIDRGLSTYIVAARADGTEVARTEAPKTLAGSLRKLRAASKRASRKQLGSQNRRKANERLSRVHGRIADQRRHVVHEVTAKLVKTHDRLCVEDLAVANMMRNRRLARHIADAAWGELHRQLAYKSVWCGAELVVAPRFFASSKTCCVCGRVSETLTLADRVFRCAGRGSCGAIIDRDRNAAANLAAWAEAEHRSAAQVPDPQAEGRVTNACGGPSAGHCSRGGETGPAAPLRAEGIRNRGRSPNRQSERTPEKGAGDQPDRFFSRL